MYGVENASEKEVEEAVRRARLQDFIASLPEGLDTVIGDRGVKLSGGEKQRVSIARALLKKPDILILDEATSALDSKTEKLIQDAIDDAAKGKTALVIAHRLSTIQHADCIVVIEDGRCIEQGTLQELLDKNGRFAEYWKQQKFF
jgi:ABC-type multidrug transport system fused ATPase/permease subunit